MIGQGAYSWRMVKWEKTSVFLLKEGPEICEINYVVLRTGDESNRFERVPCCTMFLVVILHYKNTYRTLEEIANCLLPMAIYISIQHIGDLLRLNKMLLRYHWSVFLCRRVNQESVPVRNTCFLELADLWVKSFLVLNKGHTLTHTFGHSHVHLLLFLSFRVSQVVIAGGNLVLRCV